MYPQVTFIPRGVGVQSLTPAGYDAAVDKIVPAAVDLARQGVEAIMVIGTSLTFYRGADFHDELLERVRRETGLPASTMSKAIIDGLHEVGASRIAVSTAYGDVVNDRLRRFLTAKGFEVLALEAFGITEFNAGAGRKTPEGIEIDFPISRQDLAEMTGTTLHTVSRLLSSWEDEGLVRSGRQKVTVTDPHGLMLIAESRRRK